jgi:hypothetical protein
MPVGAAPPAGTVFTMDRPGRIILLLLLAVAPALRGLGDAIFLTRAMTATTIAEVFIEEGSVRVELEIGLPDLGAFLNIMPDELYGQLAKGQEPLADRLQRFFREDFVVRADGGEPIVGELQRVVPRGRVRRDEITGEPIPVIEADQEYVVFAELAYALEGKPEVLSFKPPTQGDTPFMRASVGFVVYHLGIAVNDFRYLGTEETLDLDWEDPWYSQFTHSSATATSGGSTAPRCMRFYTWTTSRFARRSLPGPGTFSSGSILGWRERRSSPPRTRQRSRRRWPRSLASSTPC